MNLKRILSIILAFAFVLLSACGGSTNDNTSSVTSESAKETLDSISLLYNSSDSLDPYKAESKYNRDLSSLLFDPLVKLDEKLQPQNVLAKEITLNGKECTVTLKSVYFTDGSLVTADDVVFSLKKALESQYTVYKKQLSTVNTYAADGTDKVIIKLSKADPYFANLLDFPIMKKDSDTRQDENKIELPPIGSGRYVFDTKEKALNVNTAYFDGVPNIKLIKLVNAPDWEVTKYNLEANNIDVFYTDLSDGVVPPMSGTVQNVPLNNLVYLGVNLNKRHVSKYQLRYIIANALDRSGICNDAYYNFAKPAKGLFDSVWEDVGNLQSLPEKPDLENVVANLEEIGYNSKDAEGFFTDSDGKTITFKLIVSDTNEQRIKCAKLITEQLNELGFKTELSILEWNKYKEALTYDNFDFYLAEVKINNNMDVSELITSNGSLSYGIPNHAVTPETSAPSDTENKTDESNGSDEEIKTEFTGSSVPLIDSAVKSFYNGKLSLFDIINAFNAEMPIIPICHRNGLTVYNTEINVTSMSTVSDTYFGITNKLN